MELCDSPQFIRNELTTRGYFFVFLYFIADTGTINGWDKIKALYLERSDVGGNAKKKRFFVHNLDIEKVVVSYVRYKAPSAHPKHAGSQRACAGDPAFEGHTFPLSLWKIRLLRYTLSGYGPPL